MKEHAERIDIPPKDSVDFIRNVIGSGGPVYHISPLDAVEWVAVLQRHDQFELIQQISDSIDPYSVPYGKRSTFYHECFVANYYLGNVAKAQQWLSRFEFADIPPDLKWNAEYLLGRMGKRIVATFDAAREPKEDEVVIVYGAYPDWHRALPISSKLFRHISLFEKTKHDVVEYNPVWEPIDTIYILNLEERIDRYYETLLTLASVGAPLHRVHHYKAQRDGLPPYVGATKNHVDVVQHFLQSGKQTCMVFEDDFMFIGDHTQVYRSIADFFSKPREYDVSFLSLSRLGPRAPHDDLLGRTLQGCTTSAGYILQASTAQRVYDVIVDGFQKMIETGDHTTYCIDRYWSKLPNMMYFRTKLGFQRPSYSNVIGRVSAYLD